MNNKVFLIFLLSSLASFILFLIIGVINIYKGNYEMGAIEIGLAMQFFPRIIFDNERR